MKKFLSEGAIEMVEKSENKANPETYIVQKNVKREQVRLNDTLLAHIVMQHFLGT